MANGGKSYDIRTPKIKDKRMSIQINFNAGAGISFNSQIHSYTQLMEQNRSELCQETNKMEKKNETNVHYKCRIFHLFREE